MDCVHYYIYFSHDDRLPQGWFVVVAGDEAYETDTMQQARSRDNQEDRTAPLTYFRAWPHSSSSTGTFDFLCHRTFLT